jgi:hypothetical protein
LLYKYRAMATARSPAPLIILPIALTLLRLAISPFQLPALITKLASAWPYSTASHWRVGVSRE